MPRRYYEPPVPISMAPRWSCQRCGGQVRTWRHGCPDGWHYGGGGVVCPECWEAPPPERAEPESERQAAPVTVRWTTPRPAPERTPRERTEATLRHNPERPNSLIAADLGVSVEAVRISRRRLVAAGEIPHVEHRGRHRRKKPKTDG